MTKHIVAGMAAFFAGGTVAQAAEISATFDSGAEGFRVSGGFTKYISVSGNPGGHLMLTDNSGSDMELILPSEFIVPLSLGDSLSFDARENSNPGGNSASFGKVTITGNGRSLTSDFFSGNLSSDWTTVDVSFDAQSWNTTDQILSGILSDLSSIVINIDSGNRDSEIVQVDSVILTVADEPVPNPAAALLFAPVAAFLIMRRRSGPRA